MEQTQQALSSEQEIEGWKELITDHHEYSLAWATDILEGQDFMEAPHHPIICDTLNRVINGEINRLIINIPPGYGKTLIAVWAFIARGLVVNPAARFIHTSYSAELVLDNSAKVKELVLSEPFQMINPMTLRDDTKAKGLWRTNYGGGMRAVQIGGGLAGFRAGHMTGDGFTGALIVDDPLKPDDANSRLMTADQNVRYNSSISSRLAVERVPIIVIMQRIAAFPGEFIQQEDLPKCGDMCEYLLRGGSGEKWHHLMLPIEIDNAELYPDVWTHGIPIDHGLPDGMLWELKHTEEDRARLERANKYTYHAQYKQKPKPRTGDPIIDGNWFRYYEQWPRCQRIEIFMDTAEKKQDANDYSVFLVGALVVTDGREDLYVLDLVRKKYTIPELYRAAEIYWDKWKPLGATKVNIEEKSSGTYLIQAMQEDNKFSVNAVKRSIDKFSRVNGVSEKISSGHVFLPKGEDWIHDFVGECEDFTDNDSHAYDDQVDTLVDAIEILLTPKPLNTGISFARGHR